MTITASIDDIRAVTDIVFGSLTEFTLDVVDPSSIEKKSRRFMTSAVSITGEWNGIVAVSCSEELANMITAAFFGTSLDDVDPEEVSDAVGEIANMIGGNVKALMPQPSQLSLPTVTEGVDYVVSFPGTVEQTSESFLADGQPLIVTVLRRAA